MQPQIPSLHNGMTNKEQNKMREFFCFCLAQGQNDGEVKEAKEKNGENP
jgi:hypothetical protein